jgi:hypothetical protein
MSETIIFQCDFCGSKSEEESAAWQRRERCRVELVLRGHRFAVVPQPAYFPPASMSGIPGMPAMPPMDPWQAAAAAAAQMGIPVPPPPMVFAPPPPSPSEDEEDARMGLVLCDECTSRIGALLGFKIETHEEISLRQEAMAREIASAVNASVGRGSGAWKAEMVDQFPTGERGSHTTTGFVKQWPNPPIPGAEKSSAEKSSSSEPKDDKGEFKPMVPGAS